MKQAISAVIVDRARVVVVVVVVVLLAVLVHGQQASGSNPAPNSINVYEDEYVRLTFLPEWELQPRYEQNGDHGVLLSTGDYKLYLRFHTGHASGIIGGRLAEALRLPWLNSADDPTDCLSRFHAEPRRVSPSMQFYSLTLDGSDCDSRVDCRIKHRIGMRWVGGYFSPDAGFFFGPKDTRAFTLIYDTNDATGLPIKGDAVTERVITEAATIIKSIRYKKPGGLANQQRGLTK